jgi:heme/copper-type cytochrome/quinol oxidase subunit 3
MEPFIFTKGENRDQEFQFLCVVFVVTDFYAFSTCFWAYEFTILGPCHGWSYIFTYLRMIDQLPLNTNTL